MKQRPWLNYHHLLYFKTIATEGGVAKAATKLRLGQPTLSTQMKQFEETLGCALFDRSKRHLQLTESGIVVLGFADEISKLGGDLIDSLLDQQSAARIKVYLGATNTVPKHIILKIFHWARLAFDCTVSITEGHGEELLRELRTRRIDLLISNQQPAKTEERSFYAKNISKMPVVICGAANFSCLKQDFPHSLKGKPFILPLSSSKLRHDVEHYLKLRGINVFLKAEVQDTSLQKLMAAHGDGMIPIVLPAAEELLGNKTLSLIGTLEDVHEDLWLIGAQRKVQNPVAAGILKDFRL